MEHDAPSIRGNADSPIETYPAGVRCPQLYEVRGRFFCALHEEKEAGHPALQQCKNWSGQVNGSVQIIAKVTEMIHAPPSRKEVGEIQQFLRSGLADVVHLEVSYQQLADVLHHYLNVLRVCPDDIFDALGIRSVIQSMGTTAIERLATSISYDEENALHTSFWRKYIGNAHPSEFANSNQHVRDLAEAEMAIVCYEELPDDIRTKHRRQLVFVLTDPKLSPDQHNRAAIVIQRIENQSTPFELGQTVQRHTISPRFRGP